MHALKINCFINLFIDTRVWKKNTDLSLFYY